VEIRFRRTWDRTVGDAISSLSCVALLGFVYANRKTRRRAQAKSASL